jgi:hypothetical protein
MTQPEQPASTAPAAPPGRRSQGAFQRLYAFLVSPRLAIALLVAVLACCLVGVTVVRGARAWELIFSTLWFNGLLVLLAISSGAAFFTRIWRRRLTLVSGGLILFHLSFVALLGGVVHGSLFHFKGVMRLTEGETLPNGELESYDRVEAGRFFDFGRLRGETTLVKMHRNYRIDGDNKRAAYEIAVGEGADTQSSIIYITEHMVAGGLRYFCSKEGYSVLVLLYDQQGREQYGAWVPLQSITQAGGGRLYATGSATAPEPFPFPAPPEAPRFQLKLTYFPSVVDREGQVDLEVSPLAPEGAGAQLRKRMVRVGERFDAGDFALAPLEIRYWVSMDVRYDPGLAVIMGSMGFGLVGMVLTLAGRLRQGGRKKAA